MKYLIFRNHTVEHLFSKSEYFFSGYSDLLCSANDFDTLIWFYMPTPQPDESKLLKEIESFHVQLQWLIDKNPQKSIIVFLISGKLIHQWVQSDRTILDGINKFNEWVIKTSKTNQFISFIDINDYFNRFSIKDLFDWKYYLTSMVSISPNHAKSFSEWFNRKLLGLKSMRKKCLVLDLDNTLWGGIVGEDGVSGIKLGDTYPGLAFRTFQEFILECAKYGVILSICSKNNLSDVEEVWQKHSSMILKKEHFSVIKINWKSKVENIQEISKDLNIGLDSLVFIDDNPVEREQIKQMLPDVEVPDFPSNPFALPGFFIDIWEKYFQVHILLDEDVKKTEQYKENVQRQNQKAKFISNEDYLHSLNMKLTFMPADEYNIDRIAQLTQKTNQFNLTTNRYTVSNLQSFIDTGNLVFCLGVKDKFGDNGITASSIIKIENDYATIDTFLLSCRVIGRNIEKQFLILLLNHLHKKGIKLVSSSYLPTKKNSQTKLFYDSMDFELISETSTIKRDYFYKLDDKRKGFDYFKVVDKTKE